MGDRSLEEIRHLQMMLAELGPHVEFYRKKSEPSKTYPDGRALPGTGQIFTLSHARQIYETLFGTPSQAIASAVLILLAGTFGLSTLLTIWMRLTGKEIPDLLRLIVTEIENANISWHDFLFTQVSALSGSVFSGLSAPLAGFREGGATAITTVSDYMSQTIASSQIASNNLVKTVATALKNARMKWWNR